MFLETQGKGGERSVSVQRLIGVQQRRREVMGQSVRPRGWLPRPVQNGGNFGARLKGWNEQVAMKSKQGVCQQNVDNRRLFTRAM